jgi:fructokinase
LRIGIDLGGTKIEAVLLDAAGAIVARRRIPTPRDDYAATLDRLVSLVRELEAPLARPARVGVGMPGAVSPATGLVKNANSVWLIGRDLVRDLETRLERTLRFANDANCFALSEATDGAAAGAEVVFGAILGTGIGGGIAIGGRPLRGSNAIAGEWGHNPLPWPRDEERPGPSCYCGRTGCIETWLSGPALQLQHAEATGRDWPPPQIVAAAEQGDASAEAALVRYEERLARSFAAVINLLDPDVIVLGGGLSNMRRLYAKVPALWGPFVFSDRVDTKLLPPRHGDSSGVRGAAWLWPPAQGARTTRDGRSHGTSRSPTG